MVKNIIASQRHRSHSCVPFILSPLATNSPLEPCLGGVIAPPALIGEVAHRAGGVDGGGLIDL